MKTLNSQVFYKRSSDSGMGGGSKTGEAGEKNSKFSSMSTAEKLNQLKQ